MDKTYSTKEKALRINMDVNSYGTIAEIGGGQEVARNFFQAGGASGTVAKSISAYDKTFSDFLYNKNDKTRYVAEERLIKMLDQEYQDLEDILRNSEDRYKQFFVFANTVETLNFNKTNEGHGWLGMKFQLDSIGDPNIVIIHVRLLENDGLLQQYTLGTLGINLIYACFNHYEKPNTFLKSLLENLDQDRIEIDMARMSGPYLDYVDNRLLSVQLVKNEMTPAVFFDENGEVQQPSDLLYKKNVLAFRGSFRPITNVGADMLKTSFDIFMADEEFQKSNTLSLCEMNLNNMIQGDDLDERDFLDRVDILTGMGQHVLISNYIEFYKLVDYFSRFRLKKIRLVMGASTFKTVFNKEYYLNLKGGILEAFGRLFADNVKVYVYPSLNQDGTDILSSKDLKFEEDIKHIYEFLVKNRKIIDIKDVKKEYLHIQSADVMEKLLNQDASWEEMVPNYVANKIKNNKLFNYQS